MTYDAAVPELLKATQQWFGSIIARPIDEDSRINPVSPSGVPIEQEACQYIIPSPTLQPAQRIQLYNQQYWWRLLGTLQDVFPLVTRLFGYHDFNQSIAIPYFCKYPPNHWSLHYLGDRLLQWIEEDYSADDKMLVYNAAHADWAFTDSFVAPACPPIDLAKLPQPGDISSLLDQPMYLQPHVHLFELPYDIFLFRMDFLQHDPDYWIDHDFPTLTHLPAGEKAYFALYRTRSNDVAVEKIAQSEFLVLQLFKKGVTIDALCQWLEKQDSKLSDEAADKLQAWFQSWTLNQFLTLTPQ